MSDHQENITQDPRSLKINFNDIEQLSVLSSTGNLHEVFDVIYVDSSVFKFTFWSTQHFECFQNMLKPGGKFVFMPSIGGIGIDFTKLLCKETLNFKTISSALNEMKPKSASGFDLFIKSPCVSDQTITPTVLLDILDGEQYPIPSLARETLSYSYSSGIFLATIAFYNNYIPPYITCLEKVFGSGSVVVTEGGELPFTVNYPSHGLLFTVTKQEQ